MMAILAHRIFQKLLSDFPENIFEVEVMAKRVQALTNVEIHPKAKLGKSFAIDHGHGTVIGETTETGENIFIYHGVTLGATGRKSKNGRRHPRLGNNIFLGNGSQILGPSVLEDDIQISSEAMILDAYLSSGVTVSPGVTVSKVVVPQGMKIFAYDPVERKYVVQKKGELKVEKLKLKKWKVD